ncbi:MAG: hypothetical protein EOP00_19155, partial [Pedobacter sp.]
MTIKLTFPSAIFSKKTVYLASVLVLLAAVVFCCFYVFSGYNFLAKWWVGLSDCIYEQDLWLQHFFTPKVKSQGNLLCIFALLLSTIGIIYTILQSRKESFPKGKIVLSIHLIDVLLILLLMSIFFYNWFTGYKMVPLVGDEVRSALDSAAMHPFQTLSYYMLPNNHILFNLANNIFFHYAEDKVITGKIISLLAYWAFGIVVYLWFKKITKSRFFAFFAAIISSLQFPVWAFAFEGRGYEWFNLAGWLVFISFIEYYRSNNKNWLLLQAFSGIVAYALVPTFMYFHFALVLFAFFRQIHTRRFDFDFWKYQALTGLFVFLFYLPAFCFSGIAAFAESRYIKPTNVGLAEFISQIPYRSYMDYCFSCFGNSETITGFLLFLSPLLLFFDRKNKLSVKISWFYVIMLLSVVFIFIVMRRVGYHRALILQFSMVLFMVIYLLYRICHYLNQRTKTRFTGHIIFLAAATFSVFHFTTKNAGSVNFVLYFSDMNYFYSYVTEGIKNLPEGSSVGFSSESYNWYY